MLGGRKTSIRFVEIHYHDFEVSNLKVPENKVFGSGCQHERNTIIVRFKYD